MLELAPGSARDRFGLARKSHLPATVRDHHRKARRQRRFGKSDADLGVISLVADLTPAAENLVRLRERTGDEQRQQLSDENFDLHAQCLAGLGSSNSSTRTNS